MIEYLEKNWAINAGVTESGELTVLITRRDGADISRLDAGQCDGEAGQLNLMFTAETTCPECRIRPIARDGLCAKCACDALINQEKSK